VDIDEEHVRAAELVDDREAALAVWGVRVDDDASVDQGTLVQADFDLADVREGATPAAVAWRIPSCLRSRHLQTVFGKSRSLLPGSRKTGLRELLCSLKQHADPVDVDGRRSSNATAVCL
jgi:hypothetical protein